MYTSDKARAPNSALSCPDTVKFTGFEKKSSLKSIGFLSILLRSRDVTLNISPAPSASEEVIIGV